MGDAAQPAERTSPASALAAFEAHMGAAEGRPEGRGFEFVVALLSDLSAPSIEDLRRGVLADAIAEDRGSWS